MSRDAVKHTLESYVETLSTGIIVFIKINNKQTNFEVIVSSRNHPIGLSLDADFAVGLTD